MIIRLTTEAFDAIREAAKAKEVFVYHDNASDTRKLVLSFNAAGTRRKSVVIPDYRIHDLRDMREWLREAIEEMKPKKPRPGASKRKTSPSIKSKVIKSLSELAQYC